MQIRPATEADLPGILAIYNDVIANTTAIYRDDPYTYEDRRAWLHDRRRRGFPVLVACLENTIVGFSTFGEFRASPGYRHTVEHTVHIHADWRARGIGGQLLEALFPYARALNIHVMIAAVGAENEGSIRFHERLGFERVACLKQVGFKFNRWLDLVLLQRTV